MSHSKKFNENAVGHVGVAARERTPHRGRARRPSLTSWKVNKSPAQGTTIAPEMRGSFVTSRRYSNLPQNHALLPRSKLRLRMTLRHGGGEMVMRLSTHHEVEKCPQQWKPSRQRREVRSVIEKAEHKGADQRLRLVVEAALSAMIMVSDLGSERAIDSLKLGLYWLVLNAAPPVEI